MQVNAEKWKNSIMAQFKSFNDEMERILYNLKGNDVNIDEATKLLERHKEIVGEVELFMDTAIENDIGN